jgi:hypothetical protein
MAREKARFRISLKDNRTGRALKVELWHYCRLDQYAIRQNGKRAKSVRAASLSVIFARLRRWLVAEELRSRRQG